MKGKRGLFGLLTALISSLLTVTAFGYWNFSSSSSQTLTKVASGAQAVVNQYTEDRAVCYWSSNTSVYYTSIEKALSVSSSGTLYVVPGLKDSFGNSYEIHIKHDITIPSSVTLSLPYEGTTIGSENRENQVSAGFADGTASLVKTNRQTLVVIDDGVTVTNNGTINVGGMVGVYGQTLCGHTIGSYTEILMKPNSILKNNKTLNVYGYIKEDSKNNGSKIEHGASSTMTMPLVIYDFKGGSYSYAAYKASIMPFSIFDFPNCQTKQIYNHGSKMIGMVGIYASAWSTPNVSVLGTSSDTCLFKMTSGTITMKYTAANPLYTTRDYSGTTTSSTGNLTQIIIDGTVSLSSMIITLSVGMSVDVNTASMDCPLCYKYQIIANSGNLNIANRMKFLGGSSLTINNGAIVNINATTSFYRDYIPAIAIGSNSTNYPKMGSAKLLNNGTLNINGSFGGLIETTETSGIVVTSSSFSASASTKEGLTSSGSSILASMETTETHTETADGYIGSTKPSTISQFEVSKAYGSQGDYWNETIPDISGASISPSSGSSSANSSKSYTLTATALPSNNSSTVLSYSWSAPDGGTLSSTTGQSVTFTTPANSSTSADKSYSVIVTISFRKSDGTTGSVQASGSYTATKKSSGCFAKGTEIMMSDGMYKKIEEISVGDYIKTWNHETGKLEDQFVTFIPYHEERTYQVLDLVFANGKNIKVLYAHGFMNALTREYEEISYDNVDDKIGNEYIFINDNNELETSKLVSYSIYNEVTECYSLASSYNLNHIVNGALCISDDISGLYNYFELDSEFKYDPVKKQQDLDTYGYLPYDAVSDFMSPEIYELFNVKYLSVSIGKGLITMDIMRDYIARFA